MKTAVLFDLDGVIYQGGQLIPGALDTISLLQKQGIPFRFITNTTRMTQQNLLKKLVDMGLPVQLDQVFAVPHAAIAYCRSKTYTRIRLVVPDREMEDDFTEFTLTKENPEAVILGDMGAGFTFELLNEIFQNLLGGAELIALHKNKYWHSGSGLTLDVGPFVSALEFASEKKAAIIGKPSPHLFRLAVQNWSLPPEEMYMVGDDLDGDIGGANSVGMKSVLVKTGKFRQETVDCSKIVPRYIISSVAELPDLLKIR